MRIPKKNLLRFVKDQYAKKIEWIDKTKMADFGSLIFEKS
jgi:hypothetical protein